MEDFKPIRLMLDSGAFSGWKRGAEISLNEYIDYCKRHKDHVAAYVNLDCIPGANGQMDHSQASIELSASKSYENLQVMKAAGLSPIPVFHQGERFHWLDKMLEDGETYIGISPYMRAHQNEIIHWMDKCFTRITDKQGRPLIKTHGFGVTACNLCIRYPWTSVDSTSWSVGGGYGSILIPHLLDGKPDYTKTPITLKISARKQNQMGGFDGLPAIEQEEVRKAVDNAGVSMSELRNTFTGRWQLNFNYFRGMANACGGHLFKNRVGSMLGLVAPDGKGFKPEPLRMYFATVLHTKHHNVFLNENGVKDRLLSYAFLREVPDHFLEYYVETGLPYEGDNKKTRPKKTNLKLYDSSEAYRVRRALGVIRRTEREDLVDESA